MANNKKMHVMKKWLKEYNDESLQIVNAAIKCNICHKYVGCIKKSQLIQHMKTKMHREAKRISQQTEDETPQKFCMELCQAMVAVNVPWYALQNFKFKSFLEKYMHRTIPDESTLRKNYIDGIYEAALQKIRRDIQDDYVWISVDETTDAAGRYIANIVVGKLSLNEASSPHLLCCSQLVRADSECVARFVNCSLLKLWPNGQNSDKVLLLVTDAAQYMIKEGKHLQVFYKNLKHLTCLAHGLHRVAEKIRSIFPKVNNFVSTVKKVFLKSPYRISVYKEIMGNVPLPPTTVTTRWGTWINATVFYAENYYKIKEVLEALSSEGECVDNAKKAIQDTSLLTSLVFIKTHFQNLPVFIKKLEERNMHLVESTDIIAEFERSLVNVPGDYGIIVREKLQAVLSKNPIFYELKEIATVLKNPLAEHLELSINSLYWANYNFAPITSCEVERIFSAYKLILDDKRHNLSIENLEKIMIVYCNSKYD